MTPALRQLLWILGGNTVLSLLAVAAVFLFVHTDPLNRNLDRAILIVSQTINGVAILRFILQHSNTKKLK